MVGEVVGVRVAREARGIVLGGAAVLSGIVFVAAAGVVRSPLSQGHPQRRVRRATCNEKLGTETKFFRGGGVGPGGPPETMENSYKGPNK